MPWGDVYFLLISYNCKFIIIISAHFQPHRRFCNNNKILQHALNQEFNLWRYKLWSLDFSDFKRLKFSQSPSRRSFQVSNLNSIPLTRDSWTICRVISDLIGTSIFTTLLVSLVSWCKSWKFTATFQIWI